MSKSPEISIIKAISDSKLFRPWFTGTSWAAWIIFLRALFALPMSKSDLEIFKKYTGREQPPETCREAWLIVGRRGGKSLIASLVAVFLACLRDYSSYLKPGEVGTVAVIASDRKQARTILRYIRGFLELPLLRKMVVNDRKHHERLFGY